MFKTMVQLWIHLLYSSTDLHFHTNTAESTIHYIRCEQFNLEQENNDIIIGMK